MLPTLKIVMTIAIVWFVAGLIDLMLEAHRKPHFKIFAIALGAAALVGYMWGVRRIFVLLTGDGLGSHQGNSSSNERRPSCRTVSSTTAS